MDAVSEAALFVAAHKAMAHFKASCVTWRMLLMPPASCFLIREANYVRGVDIYDELSDGAFDAHLPFVNPIAKLALSRGNTEVFTLLCSFLGEHHF